VPNRSCSAGAERVKPGIRLARSHGCTLAATPKNTVHFQLKDLLQAVGPNASLVFAAWIFLGFLETRYVASFERYRELADEFRSGPPKERHDAVRGQIELYRRRCEWIRLSTSIGVVSAMSLLCTLILAGLDVVFSGHPWLSAGSAICAIGGLLLVVVAAAIVVVENVMIGTALRAEITDIPELRDR
jgi:hypothetical protein